MGSVVAAVMVAWLTVVMPAEAVARQLVTDVGGEALAEALAMAQRWRRGLAAVGEGEVPDVVASAVHLHSFPPIFPADEIRHLSDFLIPPSAHASGMQPCKILFVAPVFSEE